MAFTLGLTKEYLNYIKRDEIVKNDDTYTIPFINGKIEVFNKEKIKKTIMDYIEANKDTLEPALNSDEEPKEATTEIALREETGIVLRKETQDFIEANIEDLKAILKEYRLKRVVVDNDISLDIPKEIREIPIDTVLSIKGNKEAYRKLKRFADDNGLKVSVLFNYFIYKLLSGFNAW